MTNEPTVWKITGPPEPKEAGTRVQICSSGEIYTRSSGEVGTDFVWLKDNKKGLFQSFAWLLFKAGEGGVVLLNPEKKEELPFCSRAEFESHFDELNRVALYDILVFEYKDYLENNPTQIVSKDVQRLEEYDRIAASVSFHKKDAILEALRKTFTMKTPIKSALSESYRDIFGDADRGNR